MKNTTHLTRAGGPCSCVRKNDWRYVSVVLLGMALGQRLNLGTGFPFPEQDNDIQKYHEWQNEGSVE